MLEAPRCPKQCFMALECRPAENFRCPDTKKKGKVAECSTFACLQRQTPLWVGGCHQKPSSRKEFGAQANCKSLGVIDLNINIDALWIVVYPAVLYLEESSTHWSQATVDGRNLGPPGTWQDTWKIANEFTPRRVSAPISASQLAGQPKVFRQGQLSPSTAKHRIVVQEL